MILCTYNSWIFLRAPNFEMIEPIPRIMVPLRASSLFEEQEAQAKAAFDSAHLSWSNFHRVFFDRLHCCDADHYGTGSQRHGRVYSSSCRFGVATHRWLRSCGHFAKLFQRFGHHETTVAVDLV